MNQQSIYDSNKCFDYDQIIGLLNFQKWLCGTYAFSIFSLDFNYKKYSFIYQNLEDIS